MFGSLVFELQQLQHCNTLKDKNYDNYLALSEIMIIFAARIIKKLNVYDN